MKGIELFLKEKSSFDYKIHKHVTGSLKTMIIQEVTWILPNTVSLFYQMKKV